MNTQSLGIQRTMSPACMPNHKIFFAYVKYTFNMGRGFIGYPKGRNGNIKLVNLSCLRTRHINMFKNEKYSSFLNKFTKN